MKANPLVTAFYASLANATLPAFLRTPGLWWGSPILSHPKRRWAALYGRNRTFALWAREWEGEMVAGASASGAAAGTAVEPGATGTSGCAVASSCAAESSRQDPLTQGTSRTRNTEGGTRSAPASPTRITGWEARTAPSRARAAALMSQAMGYSMGYDPPAAHARNQPPKAEAAHPFSTPPVAETAPLAEAAHPSPPVAGTVPPAPTPPFMRIAAAGPFSSAQVAPPAAAASAGPSLPVSFVSTPRASEWDASAARALVLAPTPATAALASAAAMLPAAAPSYGPFGGLLFKYRCGRPPCPGELRPGRAWDTCCRECMKNQPHSCECDERVAASARGAFGAGEA